MVTASGLRLFDFEFSGFSYDGYALATIDAVFPRMHFPSCWCAGRLPPDVVDKFEAAYRERLSGAVPAAEDERLFSAAMSLAASAWLLSTLAWQMPRAIEEDRPCGTATLRPRVISRLKAYLGACESYEGLPTFENTARDLLPRLQELWRDAGELPLYPAFASAS